MERRREQGCTLFIQEAETNMSWSRSATSRRPAVGGAGAPPVSTYASHLIKISSTDTAPAPTSTITDIGHNCHIDTLSDIEFYNRCLVGNSDSFTNCLGVSTPHSTCDSFSTVAFPFTIKMDRLRTCKKCAIRSTEIEDIRRKLSISLVEHFGYPKSEPIPPSDEMTYFIREFYPFRELAFEQERARKVAEAERVRVEAEHARSVVERERTIAELGEIRKIGCEYYIIKNNEVFRINSMHTGLCQHCGAIRRIHTCTRCGKLAVPGMPIKFPPVPSHLTTDSTRSLRGSRVFPTVEDAEAHWIAVDEADIVAEAERRIADEERLAVETQRETRIRTAMQNLRNRK